MYGGDETSDNDSDDEDLPSSKKPPSLCVKHIRPCTILINGTLKTNKARLLRDLWKRWTTKRRFERIMFELPKEKKQFVLVNHLLINVNVIIKSFYSIIYILSVFVVFLWVLYYLFYVIGI